MNLLNIRRIRKLLGSNWFPIVPQLVMLVVFGLLIAGGIGVTTDDPGFAKWLRNEWRFLKQVNKKGLPLPIKELSETFIGKEAITCLTNVSSKS